jgi:hypothetical protein
MVRAEKAKKEDLNTCRNVHQGQQQQHNPAHNFPISLFVFFFFVFFYFFFSVLFYLVNFSGWPKDKNMK